MIRRIQITGIFYGKIHKNVWLCMKLHGYIILFSIYHDYNFVMIDYWQRYRKIEWVDEST